MLEMDRMYYRFPLNNDELIDHSLIFVVGPMARNTKPGLWPPPKTGVVPRFLIGRVWQVSRAFTTRQRVPWLV